MKTNCFLNAILLASTMFNFQILEAKDVQPILISASATSVSPDSASAQCVLTVDCKQSWSPGTKDSGMDEGLYYQFSEPQKIGAIEVVSKRPVTVSVNGFPISAGYSPGNRKDVRQFFIAAKDAEATVEPLQVKSLFIRIAKADASGDKAKIDAVRFYKPFAVVKMIQDSPSAKQLSPILPTMIETSVTATSILEPQTAYQPANLFDSKTDFAWSTNGKTSGGVGEVINLTFQKPIDIGGMIAWGTVGKLVSELNFSSTNQFPQQHFL